MWKLVGDITTYIFVGEAVLKILAYGLIFGDKCYLRNLNNAFDFFIVLVALFSMFYQGAAVSAD